MGGTTGTALAVGRTGEDVAWDRRHRWPDEDAARAVRGSVA